MEQESRVETLLLDNQIIQRQYRVRIPNMQPVTPSYTPEYRLIRGASTCTTYFCIQIDCIQKVEVRSAEDKRYPYGLHKVTRQVPS
jgi:hypothetical protein